MATRIMCADALHFEANSSSFKMRKRIFIECSIRNLSGSTPPCVGNTKHSQLFMFKTDSAKAYRC